MTDPWPTLVAFIAGVLLLYLLQRWISQHVQGMGLLLFGSTDAGMTMLWFVLLPGILVHELSHWLMAKLLGLKTGRLRIWPQRKGKEIILGSVEIQQANPLLDSLVGLAPFLSGTFLLLIVGYWAFDAGALGAAWGQRAWGQMAGILLATLEVADSWLWLYLVMAISNAMMPSPTDTVSWRPLLIYLALVSGVLLLFGWWPTLPETLIGQIISGLQTLTYSLGLTIVIDLAFALLVWLLEFGLGAVRGSKVVYK